MEKESLNLRVTPQLKAAVKSYAEAKGLSINTAATLLIEEGARSQWNQARADFQRHEGTAKTLLKLCGYDGEAR